MSSIPELKNIISFLDFTDLPAIGLISKEFNTVISKEISMVQDMICDAEEKIETTLMSDYTINSVYFKTEVGRRNDIIAVRKSFYSVSADNSTERIFSEETPVYVGNDVSDLFKVTRFVFKTIKKDHRNEVPFSYAKKIIVNCPDHIEELLNNKILN